MHFKCNTAYRTKLTWKENYPRTNFIFIWSEFNDDTSKMGRDEGYFIPHTSTCTVQYSDNLLKVKYLVLSTNFDLLECTDAFSGVKLRNGEQIHGMWIHRAGYNSGNTQVSVCIQVILNSNMELTLLLTCS